jgi:hypothetical protein
MRKIRFKKEPLSIKNIGKQRFWIGIISGLIAAVILSLFFNKTREVFRFFTSLTLDLIIFEKDEFIFFNYFFVSLATVLGFSITIWIWLGRPIHKKRNKKLYKQLGKTNIQFFFWLVLFLVGQLFALLLFLHVGRINSTDVPLNLYDEFKLLFILIPVVIFGQNWFYVRLIYKTRRWTLLSIGVILITIICLFKTTTSNQSILNNYYFNKHHKYFSYIESELSNANKEYNTIFQKELIQILKEQHSYRSILQVEQIKDTFSKDKKIALETIILQKIIIHNKKAQSNFRNNYKPRTLHNWKYALPKDILTQIQNFNTSSPETKELFNTLKEMILFVNKADIVLEDINENYYDGFSKKQNSIKVNEMLVEQLNEVIHTLEKSEKYTPLIKILPQLKTSESLNQSIIK